MVVSVRVPGAVIGVPGGSLTGAGATWAVNTGVARAGQRGEQLTARVLGALALQPGGPTVLHDLRIPIPGFTANIDHAVVSGDTITLLDSKMWRPGFYWTLGALGGTHRGLERFDSADKKTLPTARASLERHLQAYRIPSFRFGRSALVVWPSNAHAAITLWAYRPQNARAFTGPAFARHAARFLGTEPANPSIVIALRELVH